MPNGTHAAPADATSDPPPALKAKPALADASAEQRELPDVRANPGAAKIPFMSLCLTPALPLFGLTYAAMFTYAVLVRHCAVYSGGEFGQKRRSPKRCKARAHSLRVAGPESVPWSVSTSASSPMSALM